MGGEIYHDAAIPQDLHVQGPLRKVHHDGKTYHLGTWGTKEAEANYRSLLASYISNGKPARSEDPTSTIDRLIAQFVAAHKAKYSKDEMCCYRSVLKPVRELFMDTPIEQFGPLKFPAVRQQCIEKAWCPD